jgi:photosystem II stability/assembly factor-like uncharacterized protein
MKIDPILWHTRGTSPMSHIRSKWLLLIILSLALLLFAACDSPNTGTTAGATPAPARVNGFGTAANHPHSLLVYPNKVLVLATHYGLFRSGDDGATWTETAGGTGQPMDGLMTFSLTSSLFDQQRIYVLTQQVTRGSKGVVGLYSSSDQGRTWKLATSNAALGNIFLAQAGNDNPDEVYVYLNSLGPLGLKVSMDAGQHFTSTGTLPFGNLAGLLPIPGAPGQLLAYSSSGIARSSDSGLHWEVVKGVNGGVFQLTTTGAHSPIYGWGDAGVYASQDGGKTFSLVYTKSPMSSLTASPQQPQILYGKTGTAIYRSTDGGHSWTALPRIKGNLFNVVADPNNPQQVYLSLSYPTEVSYFNQASNSWTSLTPKP